MRPGIRIAENMLFWYCLKSDSLNMFVLRESNFPADINMFSVQ